MAGAYREGLVTIAAFYRKLPEAFGPLTRALFGGYTSACQAAASAPDLTGVEDIAAALTVPSPDLAGEV